MSEYPEHDAGRTDSWRWCRSVRHIVARPMSRASSRFVERGASTTSCRAHVVVAEHRRRLRAPTCACSPSGWRAAASSTRPTSRRTAVRRYVAYLTTREFARRSIARKAAALRRYFRGRCGTAEPSADPTIGLHSVAAGPAAARARSPRARTAARRRGARGRARLAPAARRRRARDPVRQRRSGLRAVFARPRFDPARPAVRSWCGARVRRSGACRSASRRADALAAWLAVRHDVVPLDEGAGGVRQRAGHAAHAARRAADPRPPLADARPIRTRCATRSPRICSTAAPTCARSRSCSATATWPPPSVTLTSAASGFGRLSRGPPPSMSIVPDDPDLAMHGRGG